MKPAVPDDLELRLCPDFSEEGGRSRRRGAVMASALLHATVVSGLVVYGQMFPPASRPEHPEQPRERVTLVLPPPELTQKAPNIRPPSKVFLGPPEPVRPPRLLTPQRGAPPGPAGQRKGSPKVVEEKPPQLTPRPDPSGTQLAQLMPPMGSPAAPPAPEPPKLELEDIYRVPPGGQPGDLQAGVLLPQRPGNVIEGTVRELARNPGVGGAVVGDGAASSGIPGGFTQPSPGNTGSSLELLSDPLGVDFKPYLTRILATVRRNWYAVIPESARLGMSRGRVVIQLIILRQGTVSKLVIAGPSGQEPLDRAAVAGISASNPFPPLPPEFRGPEVRLQFTFLYNIPVR